MLSDDDRKFLTQGDYDNHNEERLVQIASARRRSDDREKKASDLYAQYSDAWMAENALLELEEVVEIGLDPGYNGDIDSFINDFAANFSWNEDSARQMQSIVDDPRFAPAREYFQKQLGCNLNHVLQKMIAQTKEFYEET